jgi:hypothetical protein
MTPHTSGCKPFLCAFFLSRRQKQKPRRTRRGLAAGGSDVGETIKLGVGFMISKTQCLLLGQIESVPGEK